MQVVLKNSNNNQAQPNANLRDPLKGEPSLEQKIADSFQQLNAAIAIKNSNVTQLIEEQKNHSGWFASAVNSLGRIAAKTIYGGEETKSLEELENKYDWATIKLIQDKDKKIQEIKNNLLLLIKDKEQQEGKELPIKKLLEALVLSDRLSANLKLANELKQSSKKGELLSENAISFAREIAEDINYLVKNENIKDSLVTSFYALKRIENSIPKEYSEQLKIAKDQLVALNQISLSQEAKKLSDYIQDRSTFKASTFSNFFYGDFVSFSGSIIGGVLVVAACGSGVGFVGGLLAMGLGGVLGSEFFKEFHYFTASKQDNLAFSTRSLLGAYLQDTAIGGEKLGLIDIGYSYSMQVAMNSAGSGASQIAGKGIGVTLGYFINKFAGSSIVKSVFPTFGKMLSDHISKSMLSESAKTATLSLHEKAVRYSTWGSIKEIVEEFGEEGTEAAMEQVAGYVGAQIKKETGLDVTGGWLPFVSPEAALLIGLRRSGKHAAYFRAKQSFTAESTQIGKELLLENGGVEKVNTQITNIISPILADCLIGTPRFIATEQAVKSLYSQGQEVPKIDGVVIEYDGRDLQGSKVKYRLWSQNAWRQLRDDIGDENYIRGLIKFPDSENNIPTINLAVDTTMPRYLDLRALFEEQYHLIGARNGRPASEFIAKLNAEAKTSASYLNKEIEGRSFERSAEAILINILSDYQHDAEEIKRSIIAAFSFCPNLDFDYILRNADNAEFEYRNQVERSILEGIEEGQKIREDFGFKKIDFKLENLKSFLTPQTINISGSRKPQRKLAENVCASIDKGFSLERFLKESPPLKEGVVQESHQYSPFHLGMKDLLEKAALQGASIIDLESQMLAFRKRFFHEALAGGDIPELEVRAASVLLELYGKEFETIYRRRFESRDLFDIDFEQWSLKFFSIWNRVIEKIRADNIFDEQVPKETDTYFEGFVREWREQARNYDLIKKFAGFPSILRAGIAAEEDIDDHSIEFNILSPLFSRQVGMWPHYSNSDVISWLIGEDEVSRPQSHNPLTYKAVVREIVVMPKTAELPAFLVVSFNMPFEKIDHARVLRLAISSEPLSEKPKYFEFSNNFVKYGFIEEEKLREICFAQDESLEGKNAKLALLRGIVAENRVIYQSSYSHSYSRDDLANISDLLGRDEAERMAISLAFNFELPHQLLGRDCGILRRNLSLSNLPLNENVAAETDEAKAERDLYNQYATALKQAQESRVDRTVKRNHYDKQKSKVVERIISLSKSTKELTQEEKLELIFHQTLLDTIVAPVPVNLEKADELRSISSSEDKLLLLDEQNWQKFLVNYDKFFEWAKQNKLYERVVKIAEEKFPENSNGDNGIVEQQRKLFYFEVAFDLWRGILPYSANDQYFKENRIHFWRAILDSSAKYLEADLGETRIQHLFFDNKIQALDLNFVKELIDSSLKEGADINCIFYLSNQLSTYHTLLTWGYLMLDPNRPKVDLTLIDKNPTVSLNAKTSEIEAQLRKVSERNKTTRWNLDQRLKNKNELLAAHLALFQDLLILREYYETGQKEKALGVLGKYINKRGEFLKDAPLPPELEGVDWKSSFREMNRKIRSLQASNKTKEKPIVEETVRVLPEVAIAQDFPELPKVVGTENASLPQVVMKEGWISRSQFLREISLFMEAAKRGENQAGTCVVEAPYHRLKGQNIYLQYHPKFGPRFFSILFPGGRVVNPLLLEDFENADKKYEVFLSFDDRAEILKGSELELELQILLDSENRDQRINDVQARVASICDLLDRGKNKEIIEQLLDPSSTSYETSIELAKFIEATVRGVSLDLEKLSKYYEEFNSLIKDGKAEKENLESMLEALCKEEFNSVFVKYNISSKLRKLKEQETVNIVDYFEDCFNFSFAQMILEPAFYPIPVNDIESSAIFNKLYYPVMKATLSKLLTEEEVFKSDNTYFKLLMLEYVLRSLRSERTSLAIKEKAVEAKASSRRTTMKTFSSASGILDLANNRCLFLGPNGYSLSQANFYLSNSICAINELKDPNTQAILIYSSHNHMLDAVQFRVFLAEQMLKRKKGIEEAVLLGVVDADNRIYAYKLKDASDAAVDRLFAEVSYYAMLDSNCLANVERHYQSYFISDPDTNKLKGRIDRVKKIKEILSGYFESTLKKVYPSISNDRIAEIVKDAFKKFQKEFNSLAAYEKKVQDGDQYNYFTDDVSKIINSLLVEINQSVMAEIFPMKEYFEPVEISNLTTIAPPWIDFEQQRKFEIERLLEEKVATLVEQAFGKKGKDELRNDKGEKASRESLEAFALDWVSAQLRQEQETGKKATINFPRFKDAWNERQKFSKELDDLSRLEINTIQELEDLIRENNAKIDKLPQSLKDVFKNTIRLKVKTLIFNEQNKIEGLLTAETLVELENLNSKFELLKNLLTQNSDLVDEESNTHQEELGKKIQAVNSEADLIRNFDENRFVGFGEKLMSAKKEDLATQISEIEKEIKIYRSNRFFSELSSGHLDTLTELQDIVNEIKILKNNLACAEKIQKIITIGEEGALSDKLEELLSQENGLSKSEFLEIGFTEEEVERFREASGHISKLNIFIEVVSRVMENLESKSAATINEDMSAEIEQIVKQYSQAFITDFLPAVIEKNIIPEIKEFENIFSVTEDFINNNTHIFKDDEVKQSFRRAVFEKFELYAFVEFSEFCITKEAGINFPIVDRNGEEIMVSLLLDEVSNQSATFRLKLPENYIAFANHKPFNAASIPTDRRSNQRYVTQLIEVLNKEVDAFRQAKADEQGYRTIEFRLEANPNLSDYKYGFTIDYCEENGSPYVDPKAESEYIPKVIFKSLVENTGNFVAVKKLLENGMIIFKILKWSREED